MKHVFSRSGFTLIEIMVVIGIISILAAVLFVNFGDARDSSRDRALMTEIKDVQLAIELYKAQKGTYPDVPACGSSGFDPHFANTESSGSGSCDTSPYIAQLMPDFIAELPFGDASVNPNCVLEYKVHSTDGWYKLTATECMSDNTVITKSNKMARCPASCTSGVCSGTHPDFSSSVAIYSFGGQCE